MKNVNVILAMLMIVFGAMQLSAQNRKHNPCPEKAFNLLDKNDDGRISKKEAEQAPVKHLSENFDKLDTNADGYIEKSEFRKRMELRKKEMMERVDTNKDGKISIDEMLAIKKKHLIEADKNKNGFLEPEELDNMRRVHRMGHCNEKSHRHHRKYCNE